MRKPDMGTLIWAAIFVVVIVFLYHMFLGKKG